MSDLFLDESGYTGDDLLNSDQPVFVLATLCCSEEACQELKTRYFGDVRAAELKYQTLTRRPRQRQMVLSFLRDLGKSPQLVKLSIMHKRYALTAKMVDFLAEPVAHAGGLDLYRQGGNIALANLLYTVIPVFGSQELFEDLLRRFQDMVRVRSEATYDRFFELLLQEGYSELLDQALEPLRGGYLFSDYDSSGDGHYLDVTLSMAVNLMAMWRVTVEDDIILIHDASSPMAREQWMWQALVAPDLPTATVGYDRRKWDFPLRVARTRAENSRDWAGLQLADIIAGATVRALRWLSEGQDPTDEYGREMAQTIGAFLESAHLVWPSTDVTPEALGTTGEDAIPSIEFVGSILQQAGHGPKR